MEKFHAQAEVVDPEIRAYVYSLVSAVIPMVSSSLQSLTMSSSSEALEPMNKAAMCSAMMRWPV